MKKITLLLIFIIGVIITTGIVMVSNNNINKKVSVINLVLNKNNVYNALIMSGIKYPDVVMSQIMLESSNLTSNLCLKNNNLLGMTVASKRHTTAINKTGYAKYRSWIESIVDYKLYQDYIMSRHKLNTKNKYIAFLHKNYAKDKRYGIILLKMSKKYELRNTYYFRGS